MFVIESCSITNITLHYNLIELDNKLNSSNRANKSPYSALMPDYVKAQEIGEGKVAPGECFPYYKECPKSIFKGSPNNKYTDHHDSATEDQILDNEIHSM